MTHAPVQRASRPFWLWLNLLSLDAPLVALVWQDFASYCFNSTLRPVGRWSLGLTVWGIYIADRLIDVRKPASASESVIHGFYREHCRLWHSLLTIVVLADVCIALLLLRPAVLEHGLIVGAAVAIYLTGFAALRIGGTWTKRPFAAILFTTGVFLVAFTFAGDQWPPLVWPAISFCTLCLGNLLLIENWERHSKHRGWVWMLILCFASFYLGITRMNQYRWYSAILFSAVGLGLIDILKAKLSRDARRVLADMVLLTPLLFR